MITCSQTTCALPGACRGTSLIRNRCPLGPCSRTMHRALWGSQGGERYLIARNPCVADCLVSSIWQDQDFFRSEVDGFTPQNQHVNLEIVFWPTRVITSQEPSSDFACNLIHQCSLRLNPHLQSFIFKYTRWIF